MSKDIAHFDLIKNKNKKFIRNLLREQSPQRIGSLASSSELSYPTVAALLKELEQAGQVELTDSTESAGGRPGIQYELKEDYQYALLLFFDDYTLRGIVIDYYGRRNQPYTWQVTQNVQVNDILTMVNEVKESFPSLSIVSMGIPGVVVQDEIVFLPKFKHLVGKELVQLLKEQAHVLTLLENDMNAVAMAEAKEYQNFAHIAYINHCVGVGIALDGKVLQGSRGYAGELEYLCDELKDPVLTFTQTILALVCVLNVPYILISGKQVNGQIVTSVREELTKRIPEKLIPELLIVDQMEQVYENGLLQNVISQWMNND